MAKPLFVITHRGSYQLAVPTLFTTRHDAILALAGMMRNDLKFTHGYIDRLILALATGEDAGECDIQVMELASL